MSKTTNKVMAQYQARMVDQIEQALAHVESLDWYTQLSDPEKAHFKDCLFNRRSELQLADGELAVPTLDPNTRLLLRFAALLTGYELAITQLTESLVARGQSHTLRRGLLLPGRDF